LNDSERDEISNFELKTMMTGKTEMKTDMSKHLNEIQENINKAAE
jgi:hypothetical protein